MSKNLLMLNGYEWRKAPSDIEFHFIINEVQYIEDVLSKGMLAYDDDLGATISLLARYYRNYKGLSKADCESKIYKYINDYYTKSLGFEIIPNVGSVLRAIERACSARRYKDNHGYKAIRDFDGIGVTQKEIDTIKQLESLEEQELLFGVLCFTKMYDETNRRQGRKINHLFYVESSVIRRCIGWKRGTTDKVNSMIGDFIDSGLLGFIENRDKYENVLGVRQPFVTKQCLIVDDGEPVLFVDNFNTLGLTWQFILGNKKVKKCSCGRYFEARSNRQKSCSKCSPPRKRKKKNGLEKSLKP